MAGSVTVFGAEGRSVEGWALLTRPSSVELLGTTVLRNERTSFRAESRNPVGTDASRQPTSHIRAAAWFTALTVLFVFAAAAQAKDELPEKISIGTWNLEWFYDDYRGDNRSDLAKQMSAPSRDEWRWRLDTISAVIAQMQPTILALQEVENRDVVYRLCQQLEQQHQLKYRMAYIPGYDFFTEQQVCVIYQSGLVSYTRREQSAEMFASEDYRNVQKHLFANFEWGRGETLQTLTLATVHFKATPESFDVRQKQARLIRRWIEDDLARGTHVVVLGDFNSEEFYGREQPDCEMLILRRPTSDSIPLRDLDEFLAPERQLTHMIDRAFDRILVSENMLEDAPDRRDLVFTTVRNYRELVIRGSKDLDHRDVFYDIPQAERDVSDHYPLMAEFVVQ